MGWVALELTDSSIGVTVVNVVWFTPFFLLALPAGVIADAIDRRRLVIVAQGLSALLLFAATGIALADQLTFPILLVLAASTGSLIVTELPARQAYMAMLVPREQLVNAMALLSSEGSVSRVFGPLLSGYLLDRAGAEGAFFAFAVLSLVIVVTTVAIRTPGRIATDAEPTRRLRGELVEGLRYLAGHQDARALVLLACSPAQRSGSTSRCCR